MSNPYPPTRPEPNHPASGQSWGQSQPSWQQPPAAPQPYGGGYPSAPSGDRPYAAVQPGYPQPTPYQGGATYGQPVPFQGGYHPQVAAPYGMDPLTGLPYSDKSKVVAGLLQIFFGGLGIGRFYTGHVGMAVAQLVVSIVTLGIGSIWGFIDGIVLLAGSPRDSVGRPLRS